MHLHYHNSPHWDSFSQRTSTLLASGTNQRPKPPHRLERRFRLFLTAIETAQAEGPAHTDRDKSTRGHYAPATPHPSTFPDTKSRPMTALQMHLQILIHIRRQAFHHPEPEFPYQKRGVARLQVQTYLSSRPVRSSISPSVYTAPSGQQHERSAFQRASTGHTANPSHA